MTGRGRIAMIGIIAAIIVLGGICVIFFTEAPEKEFRLKPSKTAVSEALRIPGTEVGTGWSIEEDPERAVREAVEMALKDKKDKTPDITIAFPTSGSDMSAILATLREILGTDARIYGGTSDSRAVLTNRGFVKAKRSKNREAMEGEKALAVMTISSQDIDFGVGSASFSSTPVKEATKNALVEAIKDAGRRLSDKPKIVLVTPTFGIGEVVLEAIEEVAGKETIVLGGTSGGPEFSVFGKDKVYKEGISLVTIYTNLPVGWVFEGGFDVTDAQSGVVTKVDGYVIWEIDNRPALDVYGEWLGGELRELLTRHKDPRKIKDHLTLHPFYRKYTTPSGQSYFLFSHPMAKDITLKEKAIRTSTRIEPGDKIYISHGTWEILINRIGNLPSRAKVQGGIAAPMRPIFGIGYLCAGVMGIIPEQERGKMKHLIGYANDNAPFITPFTWGEQGHFPGIGNRHGNLLTSFLIIGK